jgi:hypothetical protein
MITREVVINSYSNKRVVRTVFSTEEKGKLMGYTTTARNIYYELTRKEAIKLAQQFAKELTQKYCSSWDVKG